MTLNPTVVSGVTRRPLDVGNEKADAVAGRGQGCHVDGNRRVARATFARTEGDNPCRGRTIREGGWAGRPSWPSWFAVPAEALQALGRQPPLARRAFWRIRDTSEAVWVSLPSGT